MRPSGGIVAIRKIKRITYPPLFFFFVFFYKIGTTTRTTTESSETEPATATATETKTTNSERACRCYAQDPVFNRLDVELLASLGVEVVRREAFGMVDEQTVVFGPGMERRHLVEVLARRPAVFFGGPLGASST